MGTIIIEAFLISLLADPMEDYAPTFMLLAILASTVALGGLAYFCFRRTTKQKKDN
jgi:hypothetical protein